jgi:hydrogenase expression/formation protein HypD
MMKYLDEFRDPVVAQKLAEAIRRAVTRPWTIMEICGGQTHTIVRYGIDEVLPNEIELVHGPGCPVCVTCLEMIDRAHAIASRTDVIFCSFGDMLRVPGSRGDLLKLKSEGSDVRTVYSPLDAVNLAASKLPILTKFATRFAEEKAS